MINAKLSITTNTIKLNGKVYCAYCGKEVPKDTEWNHYDNTNYYHCDCESSLKEIEILKEIRKAKDEVYKLEWKLGEIQKTGRYQVVKRETVEII